MAMALLLTALALPVALFWLLKLRFCLSNLAAAAISIAVGWFLNIAWAHAANESTTIAVAFGWVCPTIFVLVTWLVWRFTKQRAKS